MKYPVTETRYPVPKGYFKPVRLPYTDEHMLTVMNFSGGKQSSALMWMLLRGHIVRPKELVVLTADPGMENSETYDYVAMMQEECRKEGIEAINVRGPNLYEDLINRAGRARMDNPPFWTKGKDGKLGRLRQRCTQFYKIAQMDKSMRIVMEQRFGLSRKANNVLGVNTVGKWIGFGYDEVMRMKDAPQKYVQFRYPLIDMKMDTTAVLEYFDDQDVPTPPRSVCNACFANGVDTFREMYENRPGDWAMAVRVDEAVRDMSDLGINDEVYVSKTLLPLTELAERGFRVDGKDEDGWSCDSGYCFT